MCTVSRDSDNSNARTTLFACACPERHWGLDLYQCRTIFISFSSGIQISHMQWYIDLKLSLRDTRVFHIDAHLPPGALWVHSECGSLEVDTMF